MDLCYGTNSAFLQHSPDLVRFGALWRFRLTTFAVLTLGASAAIGQRTVDLIIPVASDLVKVIDREALSKLSANPMYSSAETVTFGFTPSLIGIDSSVSVRLPNWVTPCGQLELQGTLVELHSEGEYAYFGKSEGPEGLGAEVGLCPDAYFDITHTRTGFLGHLAVGGRRFVISSLPSGLAAFAEVDTTFTSRAVCGLANETDSLRRDPEMPGELSPRTRQICTISILVAATDEAAAEATPNLNTVAQSCVNSFNNVVVNSRIERNEARLVLAGTVITALDQTDDSLFDLGRVENELQSNGARSNVEADVVVWLAEDAWDNGGVYGEARLSSTVANPYAVVNIDHATGSTLVFAHEVGHLFDLRHENDFASQGFNHAYKQYGRRSVVYQGTNDKVPYFSSPEYSLGTYARSNNARTLFNRACLVAEYFPDIPVDLDVTIKHPFGACEYETVVVSSNAQSGPNGTLTHRWEFSFDYVTWQTHPSTTEAATVQVGTTGVYVRVTVTSDNNGDTDTFFRFIESYPEGSSECGGSSGGQYLRMIPKPGAMEPDRTYDLLSSTTAGIRLVFYNEGRSAPAIVRIADLAGRTLSQSPKIANESLLTLNVAAFPSGVYILSVESEAGAESQVVEIR